MKTWYKFPNFLATNVPSTSLKTIQNFVHAFEFHRTAKANSASGHRDAFNNKYNFLTVDDTVEI